MTKKPKATKPSSTRSMNSRKADRASQPVEKPAMRSRDEWLTLAPQLDALVAQYKVPAYIQSDPIQVPHRFADDPKACELVAFITALFSYGRRDLIIETINRLFQLTDNDPVGFMEQFNSKRDAKRFAHFIYRFNKGPDLVFLWERLKWAYQEYGSLEALFMAALEDAPNSPEAGSPLKQGIAGFTDRLLLGSGQGCSAELPSYGLKFLFAHPAKGGACKRFNMFLRWMVRQDTESTGKVDFGLWKNALKPADLLVPLDTHILNMNRKLGLSTRTDGSWQTAEAITDVFRLLCPEDPVKYDYALFGFSLDKRHLDEILPSKPFVQTR